MSIYLEGTLPWLFDPDSPEFVALAREADANVVVGLRTGMRTTIRS